MCFHPPLSAVKPDAQELPQRTSHMLPRKRQRVAEIGRVRVTAPMAAAAAAPAAAPGAVAGMESEPLSDADLREAQTVKRIEEHLTTIFKRDRETSAKAAAAAARTAPHRPSLQIKLLPTHMTIEGLNLALPYSQVRVRARARARIRARATARARCRPAKRSTSLCRTRRRTSACCARSSRGACLGTSCGGTPSCRRWLS